MFRVLSVEQDRFPNRSSTHAINRHLRRSPKKSLIFLFANYRRDSIRSIISASRCIHLVSLFSVRFSLTAPFLALGLTLRRELTLSRPRFALLTTVEIYDNSGTGFPFHLHICTLAAFPFLPDRASSARHGAHRSLILFVTFTLLLTRIVSYFPLSLAYSSSCSSFSLSPPPSFSCT